MARADHINGRTIRTSSLLACLVFLFLGAGAAFGQDDNEPLDVPGVPAAGETGASVLSRSTASLSNYMWCACNGYYPGQFIRLSQAAPTRFTLNSVEVAGDMSDTSEYLEFGISGATLIRYQGNGDNGTYTRYSYSGPQPEVRYVNGWYGFFFNVNVPSSVNFSPPDMNPGGAYWKLNFNVTAEYQDLGPTQPPTLQSITPGNGELKLNITPPASGPTPYGYTGYCGRDSGQVSQSLISPVSIAASGFTNSYLTATSDSARYVVGNVTGSVNISHQWRGELELKLFSPSGQSATLWTGGELDSNTSLSFNFSKSDFNGTYATGDWRLRIEDRVEGDGGTLSNWSISFNTREQVDNGVDFSPGPGPSNSLTQTVSSLTNGETYSCYATSWAGANEESGASNSRSALVGGAPGKPIISVEPEDKTALVYVNSVATGGLSITQYEGVCQSLQGSRTSTSTSKTIEVRPLTNELGYLCKARARNQQGWGPYSDEEKVRPGEQASGGLPIWLLYVATNQSGGSGGGTGDDTGGSGGGTGDDTGGNSVNVPGTPGTPTAKAGSGQVTLTWAAPSGGAQGYTIQSAYASDGVFTTVVPETGSANTSFTIDGLANGVSYKFRVAAINNAGLGPNSAASNTATPLATLAGCDKTVVTCMGSTDDLGERGDLFNQGWEPFEIPAAGVLSIPFTTSESIFAFNRGYVDRFSGAPVPMGFTFHTWWSDEAGGQPRADAACTNASTSDQGRVYWRDSSGTSDCGLGIGENDRWLNLAICNSSSDCLPVNDHTYYQSNYFLDLRSTGY